MTKNYISPSTRVIRVALDGLLMNSLRSVSPQTTETYDVNNDDDNWM